MIRPKAPINVQFELTELCPHHCIHCYNYWRGDEEQQKKPTPEQVSKLLDISKRIADAEVFHVVLTGGEPLVLEKDDLERIISTFKGANMSVGVNTNITLATPEHAEIFRKYKIALLTSLISYKEYDFDTVTNNKGAFKRFLKAAKMLTSNGVYVSSNMVVDKTRVDDVYETGKLAAELGFKGFNATRISPANNGLIKDYSSLVLDNKDIESMLSQLLAVKKDFGLKIGTLNALPYCSVSDPEKYKEIFTRSCVAGLTTAGVSADGDVRACQHFDKNYGNILEKTLGEIWASMPVWKNEFRDDDCPGCAYNGRCGTGCRENAYKLTGDINGEDNLKAGGSGKITKKWDGELKTINAISIPDRLLVREEPFGGIVLVGPAKYSYVDNFTFHALKGFTGREFITKKDMLEIGKGQPFVNERYVDRVFSMLVNNHVASEYKRFEQPEFCSVEDGINYRFPVQQEGGMQTW